MELPAVAKSFYAFCKKCDSDRYHKVLAHTGTKSARLQCEVCASVKSVTFKKQGADVVPVVRSSEGGGKGSGAAKAAQSRQRAEHEARYQELSEKFTNTSPIHYTVKGQYTKEDVITHPQFGLGFVFQSTDVRIDVVFKDTVRALIHRRT